MMTGRRWSESRDLFSSSNEMIMGWEVAYMREYDIPYIYAHKSIFLKCHIIYDKRK